MWAADAASAALGHASSSSVGPGRRGCRWSCATTWSTAATCATAASSRRLADSAFALACNSHGTVTVAAGFDVDFLESARLGDRCSTPAHASVALRGRSGLYDVTVRRPTAPSSPSSAAAAARWEAPRPDPVRRGAAPGRRTPAWRWRRRARPRRPPVGRSHSTSELTIPNSSRLASPGVDVGAQRALVVGGLRTSSASRSSMSRRRRRASSSTALLPRTRSSRVTAGRCSTSTTTLLRTAARSRSYARRGRRVGVHACRARS